MLHGANQLIGFSILATDGELGKIDNVYFDDHQWTIRYFVVDTGGWLSGRKVLISPFSVQAIVWDDKAVQLNLSQRQIEHSPDIDTDNTVIRQREAEFHDHFGYPHYWTGPFAWGSTAFPAMDAKNAMQDADSRGDAEQHQNAQADADRDAQRNLRSCKEVAGCTIQASDDAIGQVEDVLFDDKAWSIQLIVVNPHNWWPGKQVLVAPKRIDRIDWVERNVVVRLTREELENSPEYDETNPPLPEARGELYRGSAQSRSAQNSNNGTHIHGSGVHQ